MLTVAEIDAFNVDGEAASNERALASMGGLQGLERGLQTNFVKGLSGSAADLAQRAETHGRNEFPSPEPATWLSMFIESFEDTTVIVLMVSAVVSLAVGIYDDVMQGTNKGWIEGVAILFAVALVAVVTATNNYNKETQFRKLNSVKDDVEVSVIRGGKLQKIGCKDLVVGDVCKVEAGDKVPADGICVAGSDVSCDESALTGETKDTKKEPLGGAGDASADAMLISGSTLSSGTCSMAVIATGANSRWGRSKSKLDKETPNTPLQEKLETLANQIGYVGMFMAACTFAAMLYVYFAHPESREKGDNGVEKSLTDVTLKAFIMAVTIVVVAVPEGLPLAVTLSLAFSTQKMMEDNNLIRVLAACETMGNATNICSDKTGTLTQNKMTVVEAWVGGQHMGELPDDMGRAVAAATAEHLTRGACLNSTANLLGGGDGQDLKVRVCCFWRLLCVWSLSFLLAAFLLLLCSQLYSTLPLPSPLTHTHTHIQPTPLLPPSLHTHG